jgi:hypothetical protein
MSGADAWAGFPPGHSSFKVVCTAHTGSQVGNQGRAVLDVGRLP